VPNLPSANCLVKVTDYNNSCKFDISNNVFTIQPAVPILLTPNGGQVLYAGTSTEITWNTATLYTTARLDYSVDNGITWTLIVDNTTNDGSYFWTIPNENTTRALVRLTNAGSLAVQDLSDSVFTIRPAVRIITPNGDNQVNLGGCTVSSITFDRSPKWSSYLIEYSLNNGATWTTIAINWSSTSNPATYNWNIPNVNSSLALVRVTPTGTTFSDVSDYPFDIIKAVTIIQPNFGGIMQAGTTYDIQWNSDGISSVYDLFYSINGGNTYTNIVTGYSTSNNKYTWTVPNIISNNCRIMIRDNVNTCKTDTSDIAFTISASPAPLKLVKPNGITDTLISCSSYTITWTDALPSASYTISHSLDGGNSWTNIVSNYSTSTHSYVWSVPNGINSANVLLKVGLSTDGTVVDWTDAYFSIQPPTYIFTGNGNWSNPSNWLNNLVPSTTTSPCSEIIIDHQGGGECILNMNQTMPAGTKLVVKPGKKLTVPGNLTIQ